MCWSGEASFALAGAGLVGTVVAIKRKESPILYMPLLWFTLMELLQGFTYQWIDECSSPNNQLLTLLGYYHICFQPFFVNMITLYFMPEAFRKKIEVPVYAITSVFVLVMLLQAYPFEWAEPYWRTYLSSDRLCSISGSWHIAWEIPLFNIQIPMFDFWHPYFITTVLLPLLYGGWKTTVYHYFFGYFLAVQLSGSDNEAAAVWCLLSIGILLVVVDTPVRKILFTNTWYGLKIPKFLLKE